MTCLELGKLATIPTKLLALTLQKTASGGATLMNCTEDNIVTRRIWTDAHNPEYNSPPLCLSSVAL